MSRSDTERLDYAEKNWEMHSLRFNRGQPMMDNSYPPHWSVWTYNEGKTTRPTLREAIDAAMDANPPMDEQAQKMRDF